MEREPEPIKLAAMGFTHEETVAMIENSIKTQQPLPFDITDLWPVNIIKKND